MFQQLVCHAVECIGKLRQLVGNIVFSDLDPPRNLEDVPVSIGFGNGDDLFLPEYPPPDGSKESSIGSLGAGSSRAWVLLVKCIIKFVIVSRRVDGFLRGRLEPADRHDTEVCARKDENCDKTSCPKDTPQEDISQLVNGLIGLALGLFHHNGPVDEGCGRTGDTHGHGDALLIGR